MNVTFYHCRDGLFWNVEDLECEACADADVVNPDVSDQIVLSKLPVSSAI